MASQSGVIDENGLAEPGVGVGGLAASKSRDWTSMSPASARDDLDAEHGGVLADLVGVPVRQGRVTFSQHRELIALSGWVTALLACIVWDQNDHEAAETARATAHRFAAEIGHSKLHARTYELDAWFALTDGRYADATSTAKLARASPATTTPWCN